MTARTIVGFAAFSIAMTGVAMGNLFVTMMIGEINRRRPEHDQVSYFGFTSLKAQRIFDEYRSLYPSGRLNLFALCAFAVAVIGMVITAVCIGIIG